MNMDERESEPLCAHERKTGGGSCAEKVKMGGQGKSFQQHKWLRGGW